MKHKWIHRVGRTKLTRYPPVRFCLRCRAIYRKGLVGKECNPVQPKWMRIKKDALAFPGQLMQVIRFTEGGTAVGWIRRPEKLLTDTPSAEPTAIISWEMGAQELNVSMLEEL